MSLTDEDKAWGSGAITATEQRTHRNNERMNVIVDRRGRTFGSLTSPPAGSPSCATATLNRPRHCECGARSTVRVKTLRTGETPSCGYWRASSDVRQQRRSRRRQSGDEKIARMGGQARRGKGND